MEYNYYGPVRVSKHVLTRYNKQYHIEEKARTIERAIPVFRTLLDFSEEVIVTLRPLRGDDSGYYDPNTDEVEADFRYGHTDDNSVIPLLTLVAHELIHAEQYFTGRLDSVWEDDGYTYKWKGKHIHVPESLYNTYIFPWELEATELQDSLALIVCAELRL